MPCWLNAYTLLAFAHRYCNYICKGQRWNITIKHWSTKSCDLRDN